MKVPESLPDDIEMARLKRIIRGRPGEASPFMRRFLQGAIYRWLLARGAGPREALTAALAPEIANATFVVEVA